MKARFALSVAIALLLGCQPQPGPTAVKPKTTGTAKPKPAPSASVQPIPLSETPRVVTGPTTAVELIGKVKLISDKGIGVISNNSGNIISDNGASIISDNGASLVSKVKYGVQQAGGTSALPEALLADAQIEVLDAAGQVLMTPDNKPVTAVSDTQGNYTLKANLPNENLILRIRLFNGGQLFAITTKDKRTDTIDIDTASSLGTAFVMDKYVKKKQAVLDLLPGVEAEALQVDMEAARVHLTATPSYQPTDLVSAADALRGKAPKLAETIQRIEAILLAGQKNLGDGLQATAVALGLPEAVTADAEGNLYVAEASAGRIRKIAKDGTVSVYAGPGGPAGRDSSLGLLKEMIMGPDGALYVVLSLPHQIAKIPPTGPMVVIAGDGRREQGAVGGKAEATPLYDPTHLCFGPDGLLYFAEDSPYSDKRSPGRILYIDDKGLVQAVDMPQGWASDIMAMTVAKDGKIWFQALGDAAFPTRLYKQEPGLQWKRIYDLPAQSLGNSAEQRLIPGPDNTVYFSVDSGHRIYRAKADGTVSVVAGTGERGNSGDGGPATQAQINRPIGMWLMPDGTLYFTDTGNALIRRIGTDGVIKTIAGASGLTQVGDALAVSINQPTGITLDPEGRLVVSEAGSHTIKRLDGTQLTIIAGTAAGFSGDGGQATAAAFQSPAGLDYHNGELFVIDGANHRVRKVDKQGVVSTLVSGAQENEFTARMPADHTPMQQPLYLVVGPDGLPYWTETLLGNSLILRLKDGFVEVFAGTPGAKATDDIQGNQGDGGPATSAKLASPTGLAFDKDGNLYVADSGNFRIRKIDKAGVITTVAGMLSKDFLPAALTGKLPTGDGTPATLTPLWGPCAIRFDSQGNLFFAELGTANTSALGSPGGKVLEGIDFGMFPAQLIPKSYARIRKVATDGKIYNVTGPGTKLLADTRGDNMLIAPLGMVFDKDNRLVIADTGQNQLKVLPKGSF